MLNDANSLIAAIASYNNKDVLTSECLPMEWLAKFDSPPCAAVEPAWTLLRQLVRVRQADRGGSMPD